MNLNIRKTIGLFSLFALLISSPCLGFLEWDEEIIKSPMPGKISLIAVVPGQQVKSGDLLCIFEVMKMNNSITATRAGFIGSLYLTVGQSIEKDESLVTILPFMPVEKEGDPMDVDELPLLNPQGNEPSLKNLPQNDLREIATPMIEALDIEAEGEAVASLPPVIASEAKPSIPEHQPSQEASTPSWIAEDSMSLRNDEAEGSEVGSFSSVVMPIPVEQAISEAENEPQTPQQEEMLPLVAMPIIEIFDNEVEGEAVVSLPFVIASEAKQSISEYQPFQEASTSSWIATDSVSPLNNEVGGGEIASLPHVIASEVKQSISEVESVPQTFQEMMLPLVAAPITEPFNVGDASDVSLPAVVMATPADPSILEVDIETQTSQQEETPSLLDAPIIEAFDNEGEGADIQSPTGVIASEAKPYISGSENMLQESQQELMLPLVDESITEVLNSEESVPDAYSPVVVIASEVKQSTSEHQVPQQVSTPSVVAVASSSPRNDEAGVSSSLQGVKVEELRQELDTPMDSIHLPWLTELLLFALLFFSRAAPIIPYRVKNILTYKAAENLNTPGYLRDAA